jgi:hypothetical protein
MESPTLTGDELSSFQTALSVLPRSMLLGPGGPPIPPSSTLFDNKGLIIWDNLTIRKMWGAYLDSQNWPDFPAFSVSFFFPYLKA